MSAFRTRQWLQRTIATLAAVLAATTVSAQVIETPLVASPLWDASGSVALHNVRASEVNSARAGDLYDYWVNRVEVRGQVGRYLTPHLKAEIGVVAPMSYHLFEAGRVPVPALPGGFGPASIDRDVTVVSFAPAVTWQFLENAFVHPYVTAGAAINVADVHRFRAAGTQTGYVTSTRTIQYDVPGIDTKETITTVRPFFSLGTKSYFNERWFARPEVQVGVARGRLGQVSLRLGIGMDF